MICRAPVRAVAGRAFLTASATVVLHGTGLAQELEDISGPGPEHGALSALVGDWVVAAPDGDGAVVGRATARTRLDGRFLEVELTLSAGPIGHALYTFGFDRRHSEFTVTAMDDTGTYSVTGRGARVGTRIAMYGIDDEPTMTRMGLTKEFVIVLDLPSEDRVTIETLFVDTRTPERKEIPFLAYELRRDP